MFHRNQIHKAHFLNVLYELLFNSLLYKFFIFYWPKYNSAGNSKISFSLFHIFQRIYFAFVIKVFFFIRFFYVCQFIISLFRCLYKIIHIMYKYDQLYISILFNFTVILGKTFGRFKSM